MPSLSQKATNFIHYCFYTLFFFTPLLLWPFTSEVFEFNKMLFVYALTIIISAAWGIKTFQEKKFEIVRTPLDIPLVLFLVSQIISTFTSIDRHTSIWGYYSRFHGGLASTICYFILFYAFVTHFSGQAKAIKNVFIAILSTAFITSIYGVLEHFGIDKHVWVQDVQNRVFSTLGQPNWLSAYLVAILPISLFGAIQAKDKFMKVVYTTLSALFLITIAFTKSQSGIGATAVILVAFGVIACLQYKKKFLLLGFALLVTAILILKWSAVQRTLQSLNKINPFYSDAQTIILEENKTRIGGSDSMAIRRVVWQGAVELGKRRSFFGTGLETFGYTYYWVRPSAHNLTSEADFLYNKAHNEFLNFLANTGFVGLATYLILITAILFLLRKDLPLLLGFISILITNYFGFSVVNIGLFFFLFPAIYLAASPTVKNSSMKFNFSPTFGTLLIVLVAIWLLLGVRRMFLADIAYTTGRSNLDQSLQAVKLNPSEPLYHAQLGNIQSLVAVQIIAPQIQEMTASTPAEIQQKAKFYLDQYMTDAINNVTKATTMNPFNVNLLKTKARTELTLGILNPKYNQEGLKSLLKITELAPTDASNYYNVGILYTNFGDKDGARRAFEKAIELKPDYEAAKARLQELKS
jgi:putative inorganic carbon (HCO3(-)) transporter